MTIAQAKTVVHRQSQGDRVKIGMSPDHIKVISHGMGLPDSVMNRENATGNKLFGVELFEIVHLSLFVSI